jgi:hypothetical protein
MARDKSTTATGTTTTTNNGADRSVETKAEKFVRLARQRARKAANAIAALSGLAAKNNYVYTTEQVTKLIEFLQKQIDAVKSAFATGGTGGGDDIL